ncbi:hypothetical protein [Mariniflexile sp. AS56]|uniref:hypothetical protein n=1 Tax=Mariniflexile sp. AS56 TaxID=3063957 RepID=UPI0026EC8A38|nr:hypothetical protein [Mariniflexile sp. AS56]MDO7173549.1 hypothetical protein [Mariniflexile sp. AS56]
MTALKLFRSVLVVVIILISTHSSYALVQLSSEEALEKFNKLHESIEALFPQNEIKTFRRESFTEEQLKTYLSQHFKQLDLIPFIKGHHALKLNTYLHSANWFRLIGLTKESINSYKEFFRYYGVNEEQLTEAEKEAYLRMRTFGYDMLADNYAKVSYLDSAQIQHKYNIKFASKFNRISYPSSINNYGLFLYWHKNDLEAALIQFKKAFTITKKQFSQHYLLGSIRDNIADIYLEYNRIKEANTLYGENFEFYKYTINDDLQSIDIPRLVSAGSQYISTALTLNDLTEATKVFNELETILKNPIYKSKILPKSQLEILKAKELLYSKKNRFEDTYAILKEVKTLEDSLNSLIAGSEQKRLTVVNSIVLDQVKSSFKTERIERENKIKSQDLKLWIITLSSSLVLLVLLLLFLRRHKNLIIAQNKQQLAEQSKELVTINNQKLQAEIKAKKRDLSDFAINLTQNQEWAKLLAEKLEVFKKAKGRERTKLLEIFEKDIQNKIRYDHDTKDFYERLDKLSDSFYSVLHTKYPNLTKTEIHLCSLIRLKIDSHTIANFQNITLSSLNTSRYRLRKKLNLHEDDNLDEFIQFL